MLTRDQILSSGKLKTEVVDIPEWGGEVTVTELTGRERDAWEASIMSDGDKVNMENVRAKLAVRTVVGKNSKRVFTDEDIEVVGNLSAAALSKIFNVASRLSGLTTSDVEELTGN